MKKRYFSFVVLLLLISFILYSFILSETKSSPPISPPSVSSTSTVNNISDNFIIGAMNDYQDQDSNYSHLNSLGFNTIHQYTGASVPSGVKHYPSGLTLDDWVLGDTSVYIPQVEAALSKIHTYGSDRKMILHRPRIDYLCYGQSSTYECEEISTSDDLWFYSFNTHQVGINTTDSGKGVRYCQVNTNQTDGGAGWVVSGLKANTEQCQRSGAGSEWKGDSESDWYIKPRIRIDPTIAQNFPNTNVCQILVYKQDGISAPLDVTLQAKNFLVDSNNTDYRGEYLEEYNLPSGIELIIRNQDWTSNVTGKDGPRGTCTTDGACTSYDNNRADIKIKWLGQCDMWIDYVKVENDVANDLLKGTRNDWIEQEVRRIGMYKGGGSEPVGLKFYIELTEFNNLPCMKYVNDKLKLYSGGKVDLMADWTYSMIHHVPWRNKDFVTTGGWIKRNYIDKVGFTQIFAESYPLTSGYNTTPSGDCFSKIPNSLHTTTGSNILAVPDAPAAYDDWLEFNMNHTPSLVEEAGETEEKFRDPSSCGDSAATFDQNEGGFRYIMKTCNEISKEADIPFIFMPQAHHWFWPGEIRREPTNEELDMMTNTAISYGAKGFIYFWYPSLDLGNNCTRKIGYGIAEQSGSLRTTNVYGQSKSKSQTIADISTRVKKWESELMSFDNTSTNSFIINEGAMKTKLIDSSYFSDVVTFKAETSSCFDASSPASSYVECPEQRYVQVATFNKPSEDDAEYFMIVNRRCAPVNAVSKPDGKRFVRVKFDANAAAFRNFNNWKIINIEDNSTVLTFDKRTSSNLELGWFEPGQGKLFKIIPLIR